jgi:hypothetical protein
VSEIAALGIAFFIPIVGELDLRVFVARRGEEDQSEPALVAVPPPNLPEAEQLEEADRRVGIGHPDHGVEIFQGGSSFRAPYSPAPRLSSSGAALASAP